MRIWKFWSKKEESKELMQVAPAPEKRFILSLDGGGMRGVIPVRVLIELDKCLKEVGYEGGLVECFDLVAGTSTGGLIALALACGDQSLEELLKTYRVAGSVVFPQTGIVGGALRSIAAERYPVDGLEKLLKMWYGNALLSQAKTKTMIMTYDITCGKEVELRSWADPDITAFQAARATTAAPTYFSPLRLGSKVLVDGGVIANNPSLFAYSQARTLWPECTDFTIISIGTAGYVHSMRLESTSGILNWLDNIVPMYSTAQKRTVDCVLEKIPDVAYFRIEDQLSEKISMDDISYKALRLMTDHAEALCTKFRPDLEELAKALKENRDASQTGRA